MIYQPRLFQYLYVEGQNWVMQRESKKEPAAITRNSDLLIWKEKKAKDADVKLLFKTNSNWKLWKKINSSK